MASANVELVRSIYARWEHGDFTSTDWADPQLEYVHADGPSPGRWTGVATGGFRTWVSAWEDFRAGADAYRELDGERVLVLSRFSGRGKTSGLELTQLHARAAHVFHLDGGKVARLVVYFDRERALADLGLGDA